MSDAQKEVENMEKFMSILMEVKVSLAEQNAKLDNLLDMKEKINETYDIAKGAYSRSKENEKDIEQIRNEMNKKADKENVRKDVEQIVKLRENTFRNIPAWISLVIALFTFIMTYLAN